MMDIKRSAYKLARLSCSILITGESGTGKTRMAKAISSVQIRKGPFIHVDCSTIAPTLFESEIAARLQEQIPREKQASLKRQTAELYF